MNLLELYTSVQGEGPRTGQPTTFVRFAGCNMRCPGWPCDTQHAIEPELWKPLHTKLSAQGVADRVPAWPLNICLTGGEPLIQSAGEMQTLVEALWDAGHTVEMFTNGSRPLPSWAHGRVRFMMDWKLPGSGEGETKREQRLANAKNLHPLDGIKFVCVDQADVDAAAQTWYDLVMHYEVMAQFWIAKAWGRDLTDEFLVDYIVEKKLPWNLNVQVHKTIWDPDKKGV
jgi:7-carboxy-7-deazaguanine synthase